MFGILSAMADDLQPLFLLSDEPIDTHAKNAFGDDRFARTVATAALGTTGPFTIGVYGGWGTGKTSALHAARSMIDTAPQWQHVVTVEFNAWRFEREPHPIVPLVATIERAIADKAEKLEIEDPTEHKEKIGWYKQAGMKCRSFLAGWNFQIKSEIGIPLVGKVGAELGWSAKESLQHLADLQKELKSLDGEHWSALRESCLSLSVFDALDRVGEAVAGAAGPTKANWPLVVVFIDDLDRCQADKAFELLESVKLVLCQPGFVFVLALNHAVVDGYLTYRAEKIYGPKQIDLHRSYLDKIVQLPLVMPSRSEKFTAFAEHLIEERISKAADPALRKGLKSMARLFALSADATPRTLVRTINGALLDIELRDPSELHGELKDERPPYPIYSELCIVQRALERSIGPELTKELARNDMLCKAILENPEWGAYDAVRDHVGRDDRNETPESAGPVSAERKPGINARSERYRDEDVARWRDIEYALFANPFLWKEKEVVGGNAIPGTALFTSDAGKRWLGNREQRLSVMKAAVVVSVSQSGLADEDNGDDGDTLTSSTPEPQKSGPRGGESTDGVESWMRDIAKLDRRERKAIEYAARRNLGLSPNARLDSDAWRRVSGLNLFADPITDDAAVWLARPDSGFKSLTTLHLGDTRLTDAGVESLARSDTGLKSLTTLGLNIMRLTDAGVESLARSDTGLNSLTTLYLYNTQATDAGAESLARSDTGLKSLATLDLGNTNVTDAGVESLARSDTGLKSLATLDLGNTNVTDAGVESLARSDTGLKSLVSLSLGNTKVTDAGVKAIHARWPGINVFR